MSRPVTGNAASEQAPLAWPDVALLVPLLASGALAALNYTAVSAILPTFAEHVGARDGGAFIAQVFMTMPSIGMMLGGLLSAWLILHVGARRLLFVALAVYGASGSCGLYASHLWPLLASRLLLGFGAVATATAGTTLMAEHFAGARRERLIGFQSSIGAGFGLLSTLVAGALASACGWRTPFALYLVGFVLMLWAIRWVPAARAASPSPERAAGARPAAGVPWAALKPLYFLCLPLYAAVFMTSTQVPFLLWDDGVRDPLVQSLVLAVAPFWNAAGAALYGRVRGVLGSSGTFSLALGLMASGNAVLGLSHATSITCLGCAITGCGAGLTVPHVPNAVLEQVRGAARGRALGVMYSLLYLGSFCNPLLMAPLASAIGRHGALLLSGVLLALGCVTALWRASRRAQALPAH